MFYQVQCCLHLSIEIHTDFEWSYPVFYFKLRTIAAISYCALFCVFLFVVTNPFTVTSESTIEPDCESYLFLFLVYLMTLRRLTLHSSVWFEIPMMVNLRSTVLSVGTLCSAADGGNMFIQNNGPFLNYMALQPRRLYSFRLCSIEW
jgi:hypothetical protein